MFSDKENINILTSLLKAHGVKRAVVCPGSRNAAIVHNLNECDGIVCYPVTDERSAGFYALGMILASAEPVAVCVTSGTALLNLAPAVAEAYYQHLPLIVISADRPKAWIGQLDGQTLPQPGAFGHFVIGCVSLPEPHNKEEHWYCNRLVNEALIKMKMKGGGPVHINVPITEPLFSFNTDKLSEERKISYIPSIVDTQIVSRDMITDFFEARSPMVVIGQLPYCNGKGIQLANIEQYAMVIREPLSPFQSNLPFDEVLHKIGANEDYMPDFILYIGGTLVSKRIKKFLRKAENAECWQVTEDGEVHDTFMNLTGIIEADPFDVLTILDNSIKNSCMADDTDAADLLENSPLAFRQRWQEQIDYAVKHMMEYIPRYSEMMAVYQFEMQLGDVDYDYKIHYANSMPVRLGIIYSESDYLYVNRGVNGIEGSLSTAAGFSVVSEDMVFCVIGDLSFFYDQNALWNQNIGGNLRILLLNNNSGGIFKNLKGLSDSPVCKTMVAASHRTSAHGICDENNIGYICAHNEKELQENMCKFMNSGSSRPLLFEVFTDPDEDARVYKEYYNY
ncbi:2-succinyl-5-enolpyruvyl-6-hydroxy-3-cyclohexene-1-carboxylic-acid synthase [Xylanibacter oryzae DSM 17970]|uniref:2-succinyl-5-enolpyruvyl-6-hydroxy-3-cyclohexene-1-carboxylate synthase n=1 Tax=Xylanibacter oryzae DSM 17970 TaxID=915438 RepID=A0ABN0RUF8_9BACT|nr:2-succinyl-5-enolpyruvyl-6-hydroxy-3-cyclohexene-1-carboxylic-acid synthase [Xylanibacter oryzae]EXG77876.1 2-succinyl-5-enolpyruvyl-6-hydroxy-3-cyclohexene-1-carboxylic-acid synthase [Xylanibacter oryzae DSM 17970]